MFHSLRQVKRYFYIKLVQLLADAQQLTFSGFRISNKAISPLVGELKLERHYVHLVDSDEKSKLETMARYATAPQRDRSGVNIINKFGIA